MILLAISPKSIFHILHWLVFDHILCEGQLIGKFLGILIHLSIKFFIIIIVTVIFIKDIMDNILTWDLMKVDGKS